MEITSTEINEKKSILYLLVRVALISACITHVARTAKLAREDRKYAMHIRKICTRLLKKNSAYNTNENAQDGVSFALTHLDYYISYKKDLIDQFREENKTKEKTSVVFCLEISFYMCNSLLLGEYYRGFYNKLYPYTVDFYEKHLLLCREIKELRKSLINPETAMKEQFLVDCFHPLSNFLKGVNHAYSRSGS